MKTTLVPSRRRVLRTAGGTVDQLVLHQGGRDMPAKKRK